ncbi:MAG: DegV family protein [Acetatifactor sp.]
MVVSDARIGNIDLETRQTVHTRERYRHTFEAPKARVGRISAKVDRLCTAFMIHPVLCLKNSSMNVGMIRIGTKEHARRQYIHKLMKAMKRADRKVLYITYAGLSTEELQEIERQIVAKCRFEEVIYQKASPAISANCGPGSFGLIFAVR